MSSQVEFTIGYIDSFIQKTSAKLHFPATEWIWAASNNYTHTVLAYTHSSNLTPNGRDKEHISTCGNMQKSTFMTLLMIVPHFKTLF